MLSLYSITTEHFSFLSDSSFDFLMDRIFCYTILFGTIFIHKKTTVLKVLLRSLRPQNVFPIKTIQYQRQGVNYF